MIPNYLDALLGEMEWYAKKIHPTEVVKSIYFGGGTPSLLEPAQIDRILSTVQKYFYLSDHPEITLGQIRVPYLTTILNPFTSWGSTV